MQSGQNAVDSLTILLPLDVRRCSSSGFEWINQFARRKPVRVILLHVVNVNFLVPDNRVYEELGREALGHLQQLTQLLLPSIPAQLQVRFGRLAEEVLFERERKQPGLVLLTGRRFRTSGWPARWWRSCSDRSWRRLASRLVETNSHVVFLKPAACFDCEAIWGRPAAGHANAAAPGDGRSADGLAWAKMRSTLASR